MLIRVPPVRPALGRLILSHQRRGARAFHSIRACGKGMALYLPQQRDRGFACPQLLVILCPFDILVCLLVKVKMSFERTAAICAAHLVATARWVPGDLWDGDYAACVWKRFSDSGCRKKLEVIKPPLGKRASID